MANEHPLRIKKRQKFIFFLVFSSTLIQFFMHYLGLNNANNQTIMLLTNTHKHTQTHTHTHTHTHTEREKHIEDNTCKLQQDLRF